MMDVKSKLEKEIEIERKRKLIEDSDNILKEVPKHLRPSQEFVLEIYRNELVLLEQELMKLEKGKSENKEENKAEDKAEEIVKEKIKEKVENRLEDRSEDEDMDLKNIRI